jgi:6-phosphogluconate dehydrogenase
MVHNGIEYGDMQLIAEAYDVLKTIGGLNNDELAAVFDEWNSEGNSLQSFLIEISAQIFKKKDDRGDGYLVDKVMDKTGNKGTGKWTCKDACDMGVDSTTMVAALNARYMACMKDERVVASQILPGPEVKQVEDKKAIIEIARQALYASKICSYAQGMSLIQKKGQQNDWNLNLGKIASIWRGGCIIRAVFLDRITEAYEKNPDLPNLLVDEYMGNTVKTCLEGWRKLICLAVTNGVAVPAMAGSLAYFDSYRRARLPANLTQAQRDFFGAHTYQRTDDLANGEFVHSEWSKM